MSAHLLKSLRIYCDKRMLVMLAFGFSSGFPFPLVFNTLSLWLKDAGLSLALIGAFSLMKTPYSLKWLWSPIIDKVNLPKLSFLGRRRSWALVTQFGLLFSLISMSLVNPGHLPTLMAALALILSITSASQDIVLDAYRIESFNSKEQGAASAVFVMGYRLGFIFSGAGALILASYLSWNEVYFIMSLGSFVGIITVLVIKEPSNEPETAPTALPSSYRKRFQNFIATAVIAPFKDFMQRKEWKYILLFIFLYRMSDAYINPMAYIFYIDVGFDYIQIATITKIYGTIATIGGMLVGGAILNRIGINKGLIICGILQGLSNLIYVAQAYAGHNIAMLIVTISVENITSGMGTAAFIAYISSLCNIKYTATQYALLSSLMSFARDIFASSSGVLAEQTGWPLFFVLTTIMALPGIILLLYMIKNYPHQIPDENLQASANKKASQ